MGLACRQFYTLPFILIIIFSCLVIPSSAICLPCQPSSRRSTPWDVEQHSGLSSRGIYHPKITNPTGNTVWLMNSEVTVTWWVSYFRLRRRHTYLSIKGMCMIFPATWRTLKELCSLGIWRDKAPTNILISVSNPLDFRFFDDTTSLQPINWHQISISRTALWRLGALESEKGRTI